MAWYCMILILVSYKLCIYILDTLSLFLSLSLSLEDTYVWFCDCSRKVNFLDHPCWGSCSDRFVLASAEQQVLYVNFFSFPRSFLRCSPWFHISAPLQGGSFDLRLRGRLKPQNFMLPQQTLNKSDMSILYSILYMSGVPSPSSNDYKHHQNHRLFCTYFLHPFAFYTFNYTMLTIGGRVDNPRHATIIYNQSMRCMPDSEFSSFGTGFGLWFSPSPL